MSNVTIVGCMTTTWKSPDPKTIEWSETGLGQWAPSAVQCFEGVFGEGPGVDATSAASGSLTDYKMAEKSSFFRYSSTLVVGQSTSSCCEYQQDRPKLINAYLE